MNRTFNLTIAGKPFNILFEEKKLLNPRVISTENQLLIYKAELSDKSHNTILIEWLKKLSHKLITEKVELYCAKYGFKYKRISIRGQVTRWGSCSSSGSLNFNWRLILAHPRALEYVVVHELAHTEELNHSLEFWNIVKGIIPEYKVWEKWLKVSAPPILKILAN